MKSRPHATLAFVVLLAVSLALATVAAAVARKSPTATQLLAKQQQAFHAIQKQEAAKNANRVRSIQSAIAARKRSPSVRTLPNATLVSLNPQILDVTPKLVQPGDPVLVSGSLFGDNKGMLVFSDGNRAMDVTSWSDTQIEAVVPATSGFVADKSVTLKVVTGAVKTSAPSQPLTLKPRIVPDQVLMTSVSFSPDSGSAFDPPNGPASHQAWGSSTPASWNNGTDTVKLAAGQLKNNWSVNALVLDFQCLVNPMAMQMGGSGVTPCKSGEGASAANAGAYQLGKISIPDLQVQWSGNVQYTAMVVVMGPEGTSWK